MNNFTMNSYEMKRDCTLYGRDTATKINITYVKPNNIILNKNLFK